jgi:hypothetical protein
MHGAIQVRTQRTIRIARFCAVGADVIVLMVTEVLHRLGLLVITIVRGHCKDGLERQKRNEDQEQETAHGGKIVEGSRLPFNLEACVQLQTANTRRFFSEKDFVTCISGTCQTVPTSAKYADFDLRLPLSHLGRFFKLGGLWFVLLALPLQGIAATGMLACGPGEHRSVSRNDASSAERAGIAAVRWHMHNATTRHAHVDSARAVAPSHDEASEQAAWGGNVSLGAGQCSACASCCVGAVIDSEPARLVLPKQSLAHTTFNYRSHVGFFTDGPERPPRTILA